MSTESDVVTLGSGKLVSRRIGPRAAFLDRAKVNGLPVPPGVIITEELIKECYSSYGSSTQGRKSRIEQNVRLVREDFLRDRLLTALPLLTRGKNWKHDFSVDEGRIKVAIRPAFSLNDGEQEPPPAMFHTELNVDGSSAIIILGAIKEVLASAHAYQKAMYAEEIESDTPAIIGHQLRRDVMIMPMVPAQFSGLAFLQHDFEDDIVQWAEGLGGGATQNNQETKQFLLPRLFPGEQGSFHPRHDFEKRLQNLLTKIRLVFGDSRDWEIEWADDGKNIWLLQIRPMARSVKRVEFLSSLIDAELLREPLSPFALSLYEKAANHAFAFLRVLSPSLPIRRRFAIAIRGRLYLNLSLLSDCLRILGLPTRFALDFLLPPSLHASLPQSGWNWRRIFRHRRVLWLLWKQRLTLTRDLDLHLQKVDRKAAYLNSNLQESLQQFADDTTETFKFVLLLHFALVLPLRLLQRLGLLQAYLMRYRFSPINVFRNLLESDASQKAPLRDTKDVKDAKGGQAAILYSHHFAELQSRLFPNYDPACPPASIDAIQKRVEELAPLFQERNLQTKLDWKLFLGLPLWYPLFRLLENKRKIMFSFLKANANYHAYLKNLTADNLKKASLWEEPIDLLAQEKKDTRQQPILPNGFSPGLLLGYECTIMGGATQKAAILTPPTLPLQSAAGRELEASLIFSRLPKEASQEQIGELLAYKTSKDLNQSPESWIFAEQLLCENGYLMPGAHLILEKVAPFSPLGLLLRGLGCKILLNIKDTSVLKDRQMARLHLAAILAHNKESSLFPKVTIEITKTKNEKHFRTNLSVSAAKAKKKVKTASQKEALIGPTKKVSKKIYRKRPALKKTSKKSTAKLIKKTAKKIDKKKASKKSQKKPVKKS